MLPRPSGLGFSVSCAGARSVMRVVESAMRQACCFVTSFWYRSPCLLALCCRPCFSAGSQSPECDQSFKLLRPSWPGPFACFTCFHPGWVGIASIARLSKAILPHEGRLALVERRSKILMFLLSVTITRRIMEGDLGMSDNADALMAREKAQREKNWRSTPEERMRQLAVLQETAFQWLRRSPKGYRHFLRRNYKSRRAEMIDGTVRPVSADRCSS